MKELEQRFGKCIKENYLTYLMKNKVYMLFKEVNENAGKDQAADIIEYFEGKVPEELREKIEDGIYDSFRRAEAESVLKSYGIDCLSNITEEEYNSMTMEERIERCMEEADGEMDFCIVEIKF